jgi:hypothetical protein
MNGLQKWIGLCLTLMAFAPSSWAAAPQKSFNAEFLLPSTDVLVNGRVNPTSVNGQLVPPVALSVGVKNESPPPNTANSNISSFQFTVTGVTLVDGNSDVACPGALCTVNSNTVFVSNISPPIQAAQTFTVTFHATSCVAVNDANLSSITVYSGSQFNGGTFVPYSKGDSAFPNVSTLSTRVESANGPTITPTGVSCGTAACDATTLVAVPDSRIVCVADSTTDPICVSTRRSSDKNGVCGVSALDFSATNNLPLSDKQLHFQWGSDSAAVFAYRANVLATSSPPWKAAWLPTSGAPVFVNAPMCRGADFTNFPPQSFPFPSPFGFLAANVGFNDNSITVTSTASPPALNSPIVIGGERMIVTRINLSNNKWSVLRAQGGTSKAQHFVNDNVMSTPLDTLTSAAFDNGTPSVAQQMAGYFIGLQTQVCQASVSHDNADGTFSAWFIDIGDAWIQGR